MLRVYLNGRPNDLYAFVSTSHETVDATSADVLMPQRSLEFSEGGINMITGLGYHVKVRILMDAVFSAESVYIDSRPIIID